MSRASTLHYGCRDGDSQPFRQRLDVLRQRLPNLILVTHLSNPKAGDRFDLHGRFSVSSIDDTLLRQRARFYVCASDKMIDDVVIGLKARGVAAFEIFKERFRSPEPPVLDGLAPRLMHFSRSDRMIAWAPAVAAPSILATAERAGLALPSGCRVGQCESCAVRITAGQVRHLVECPDLEEGFCLTCQAIPLTDVTLDG